MTVVIDSNEPPSMRMFAINECEETEVTDLPCGDFIVGGHYIIERKTFDDYIGRLTTDAVSIWDQLDAISAEAQTSTATPALIIEGNWSGIHSNINPASVVGSFVTVADRGVHIIPTPGKQKTASMLASMERAANESGESEPVSVRQSPSISDSERPQHIVEGLPGVSAKRAQALLSEFETVGAVFAASEDALTTVDGIGAKTASNIRAAIQQSDR